MTHTIPMEISEKEVERLLSEVEKMAAAPMREPVRRLRDRIEENHQSQMRLVERERFFESMVEHAPESMGRIGRDLRYQYANGAIECWTGKRPEEVVGRTHRELGLPGDLCSLWERHLREAFATRQPVCFEVEVPIPGGRKAFRQPLLIPEVNAQTGEVDAVLYIEQDVTGIREKEAEDRMRTSEAKFRHLAETLPQLVWVTDGEERIVYVNPQWVAYAAEKIQTRQDIWARLHPEDVPQVVKEWREAQRRGHFEAEYRLRRHDGEFRWFLARSVQLRDARGQPSGWLGTATDMNELKRAQDALSQSRDQLTLALEAGHAGFMAWDLRTNKLQWNTRSFELFGYAPFAIDPDHEAVRRRMHPEDLPRMDAELRRTIEGRVTDRLAEYRVVWPDGQVHWLRSTGRFTYNAEGRPETYIGITICITALKQAQAAMTRARELAERASSAKDDFIAVLSHELRTPLTPALTALQLMDRDQAMSSEQRDLVDMAQRNVALETRLIDNLLDLTRITRGKLELHSGPVDLHILLGQVLEILDSDIKAKNLRLATQLTAEHHHVQGDSMRLHQVFWNLLKNAIKFTPDNGYLFLRTDQTLENRIAITLQDTGIGIEPELLPALFQPFEQGDKEVTRRFGGLGLGLSISRGIVELHGGTLKGASRGVGLGSTFTVELPLSLAAERMPPPQEAAAPGKHACRRGGRILLVEDHRDTSRIMSKVLRGDGYDVRVADSVATALRATDIETFDLVISDIGLPDGSGLDLMRQLTVRRPTKAIALSGFGNEEDVKRSKDAGFVHHLTKPVDIAVLEEMIGRMVE